MTVELAKAKEVVLLILERGRPDQAILPREGFAKIVKTLEDRDPKWLVGHLRDPKFDKTTRAQVASFLTGDLANVLLLELHAD